MEKITKAQAIEAANQFEQDYAKHREAVLSTEKRIKTVIAREEQNKAILKCYAEQNAEKLFPNNEKSFLLSGNVVFQQRASELYNVRKLADGEILYLARTYPDAFAHIKSTFIPSSDDHAQQILNFCAYAGKPNIAISVKSDFRTKIAKL